MRVDARSHLPLCVVLCMISSVDNLRLLVTHVTPHTHIIRTLLV